MTGASAHADRAGGLRPEPVPVSAVPALIPSAFDLMQQFYLSGYYEPGRIPADNVQAAIEFAKDRFLSDIEATQAENRRVEAVAGSRMIEIIEKDDEIARLEDELSEARSSSGDPTLDSHIFEWFNERDCEEMRACLDAYRATAQGIEAATADETRSGSAVGESPVTAGHAPDTPDLSTPLPSGSIER